MSENTADVSVEIDAPAKEVWDALTDPSQIKEYYLGASVDTDWNVGSPITWSGDWKGKAFEDKGEILAADTERKLAYTHWSPLGGAADEPANYHVVQINLTEAAGGTEVRLTQSNLNGNVTDADRGARGDYEKNWTTMLEGLKRVVESKDAPLT